MLLIPGVNVETVIVLAVVVAGLITIDRIGLWAERKGWIFWRKGNGKRVDAGSGALAVMDELFAPSKTHVIEEVTSKQTTRVDQLSGQRIDLPSGRVYLNPTTASPPHSVD